MSHGIAVLLLLYVCNILGNLIIEHVGSKIPPLLI